jgi:L-rhamnose mutarotase
MASYAWVLEVRPGYEELYKLRHDALWPEMLAELHAAGIHNSNVE